jgi:hypothetical protein
MKTSLVFVEITFIALFGFIVSCGADQTTNSTYNSTKIESSQIADVLYISTENWGMTGDQQVTYISTKPILNFDSIAIDECYKVEGLEPFLYRQSNDTLFLNSQVAIPVPPNFKSEWKIVQIITDNPALMNLRENEAYKKP